MRRGCNLSSASSGKKFSTRCEWKQYTQKRRNNNLSACHRGRALGRNPRWDINKPAQMCAARTESHNEIRVFWCRLARNALRNQIKRGVRRWRILLSIGSRQHLMRAASRPRRAINSPNAGEVRAVIKSRPRRIWSAPAACKPSDLWPGRESRAPPLRSLSSGGGDGRRGGAHAETRPPSRGHSLRQRRIFHF